MCFELFTGGNKRNLLAFGIWRCLMISVLGNTSFILEMRRNDWKWRLCSLAGCGVYERTCILDLGCVNFSTSDIFLLWEVGLLVYFGVLLVYLQRT